MTVALEARAVGVVHATRRVDVAAAVAGVSEAEHTESAVKSTVAVWSIVTFPSTVAP